MLQPDSKPRVCAVSYLNTVPLVWGMLHSPDPDLRTAFDLSFAVPSVCADRVARGEADIGILPVIEMARQRLSYFPGTGIACHGAVRTILLIAKVPFPQVKTLATDSGSRTSVMLSRVILAEKYGATPELVSMPPDLESMLAVADAALIIGDAALKIDPATVEYPCLDLGAEWTAMTGLPMVFAVWSGVRKWVEGSAGERRAALFLQSCRYGLEKMDDIVRIESARLGFEEPLVRHYLTRNLVLELGDRDYQGMRLYLEKAMALENRPAAVHT